MTEAPEPLQVWVDIRKNATGEVRRVKEPKLWRGDADTPDFWWTDGNAGCDCNRELFFLRVKDEPEDEAPGSDEQGVVDHREEALLYEGYDADDPFRASI